jgi:hypothetical protein
VAFSAFFSSEVWFSAAIALQAWLTGVYWRRPPALMLVGAGSAAAFVVRPQFLLTWAIEMTARTLWLLWRRGVRTAARDVAWLVLPAALALSLTSVRFHRLTGHFGLMNESGANRLWADTDVCQIQSKWRTPNGEEWNYWFSPPSKPARKPSDTVSFEGYIVDPDILERIRQERVRGVPWRSRLLRKLGNVKLLLLGNLPWPESNYRDPVSLIGLSPWVTRVWLQETFRDVLLFAVLPLTAIGLALGPRNRTMLILAANFTTLVIAAAFFFGEARYHVPYDPFAIVLAVVGVRELFVRARRVLSRPFRRTRAQV